jgi:hypothetical protein
VVLRILLSSYLLLSLTAITSISTRKPGLASAATPTTGREPALLGF